MAIVSHGIICDGCGLPASPEHIAERLGRLELATRFRPIHINVLFVALAPMAGFENDFYGTPVARDFFDSMMNAAGIVNAPEKKLSEPSSEMIASENDATKLAEFQHRGYYVSYLSECPIAGDPETANAAISRLSANLVRRIRFNYRPKQIALLESTLAPLIEILEKVGLGPLLELHAGRPLNVPEAGDLTARSGHPDSLPTT